MNLMLVNLGLLPIFDPFPHIDEERYTPPRRQVEQNILGVVTRRKIIEHLKREPGASIDQIAHAIGKSHTGIARHLQAFEKTGVVMWKQRYRSQVKRWYLL